ncbi:MAG: hypothetical protein MMC23_008830 [Stictis urceolatum]|nr:hypothetical protein [Stictis urceolata]
MAESTAPASPPVIPIPAATASATKPVSPASTPITGGIAALASASQFLKPSSPRKRRRSPEASARDATASGRKSPSPVSPKTTAFPPPKIPLTGAAEMSEQKRRKLETEKEKSRQKSENPQIKALGALMGVRNDGISRPEDAPARSAANTTSTPVANMAPVVAIPNKGEGSGSQQTSPASAKSISTMESTGATTITASGPQVASPGQMREDEVREQEPTQAATVDRANGEGAANKSFTYPGPLLSAQMGDGRRGMSLPGSGMQRDDSRSPSSSNKKHKCPYCSTDFTRHHNLKSHLLTHSHEKPYLCQTCDSRFRRLHDLKRHTKLHTGERPHVCPKCLRSFARGDALARHNKGQGGCAGRRSSAGSFNGDHGDEPMEGMIYTTGDASQEPDNMDDDGEGLEETSSHLPSIRRHDAPPNHHLQPESQAYYQRQPSTYPPVAARAPVGRSLYPPAAQHGGSGGPTSPSSTSSHIGFPPTSTYPSNPAYGQPMTESPKPLSPSNPHPLSAGDPRNRSPSLSSQLAAQPYPPRRAGSRNTPPPTLPPPHSAAPTLPLPHGLSTLNPPEHRYSQSTSSSGPLPPGGSLPHPHPQPHGGSFPGPGSVGSNSLSSHGTAGANSGDRGALPYGTEERLWALVKTLESKVERLEAEVGSLRSQLQHQQQQSSPVSQPSHQGVAR